MEIIGKVISIMPIVTGTSKAGNAYSIKSFVIETQETYPKKVCIELFGDQRINDNPIAVDQVITVSFDLESREFNGKWYTSVRAWKIQQGAVVSTQEQTQAPAPMPEPQVPIVTGQQLSEADFQSGESGDLPF